MDFPINALAEGRVLVPWEHRMYPNTTLQDTSGMYIFPLFLTDILHFNQVALNPSWDTSKLTG